MPCSATLLDDPGQSLRLHVQRLLDEAAALLESIATIEPAEQQITVHEVRKRCKEARALARMLGVPGKQRRRFDAKVADAARQLAATRDRQVMRDTLDGFAADIDGQAREAALAELGEDPTDFDASVVVGVAATALAEARAMLDDWQPSPGREPVLTELQVTYRLARRRFRHLRDSPDDIGVHEWRKAVKRLWYQARAVQDVAPDDLDRLVARLDQLGQLLGDDHDITVLVAALDTGAHGQRNRRRVADAVKAGRRRQRALRRRSLRLGERAFDDRPKVFATRLTAAWNVRRSGDASP